MEKNKRIKNLHPSYPTLENEALDKYSEDFYDTFAELIQNEDQLIPKNLENLNEQVGMINQALEAAAEGNLKPRERIDRTFEMPGYIR